MIKIFVGRGTFASIDVWQCRSDFRLWHSSSTICVTLSIIHELRDLVRVTRSSRTSYTSGRLWAPYSLGRGLTRSELEADLKLRYVIPVNRSNQPEIQLESVPCQSRSPSFVAIPRHRFYRAKAYYLLHSEYRMWCHRLSAIECCILYLGWHGAEFTDGVRWIWTLHGKSVAFLGLSEIVEAHQAAGELCSWYSKERKGDVRSCRGLA